MESADLAGGPDQTRKRKRDGKELPLETLQPQEMHSNAAEGGSQLNRESSLHETLPNKRNKQEQDPIEDALLNSQQAPPEARHEEATAQYTLPRRPSKKHRLPKLPKNAQISKRPLHRPAIPHPHASSSAPKVLYIKHSTPFVPAIKRIKNLLRNISDRAQQSQNAVGKNNRKGLRATGHLDPKDVEREIADASARKQRVGGERVYLKATGRAIARALEIGVFFQREVDCDVKIELGSVKAIDDIEVRDEIGDGVDDDGGEAMDVDVPDEEQREAANSKAEEVEDIPETRIRTVSAVTVAIGLA